MTSYMMLDKRHLSLARMMAMTLVICNYVQLAGSAGILQVKVLSFLSDDLNTDYLSHTDRHGKNSNKMDDDHGLENKKGNCSVHIEICLSHHLLPLPRGLECTLGHVIQDPWRSGENLEIPFSFKWPGALTASVKVTSVCKTDKTQQKRTIAGLVFAHDVLPSKIWTHIPQCVPSSRGAEDDFDFQIPSRRMEIEPQTRVTKTLAMPVDSDINVGIDAEVPSKTFNLKVEAHGLNNEEILKANMGLNIQDPFASKTRIVFEKQDGGGTVHLNENKDRNQQNNVNSDSYQKQLDGQSFVEVIDGHLDSTDISNNSAHSKNDTNSNIIVEEENDIIFEIIPNEQTSVSYREGGVSVIFRVVCQQHYYGDGCSEFCRPKDDLIGHFRCSDEGEKLCLAGWAGPRCTTAVCRQQCPIERGTCTGPNECTCKPGWYGHECEQCRTARGCRHGRCENRPGQCLCHKGWAGPLCDVERQYCVDNQPCHNNGKCIHDQAHNYTCLCTSGYTGTNCQVPVCHMHFCLHGGTCLTSEGTRYCLCPAPFKGPRCQHFNASISTEKTTKPNVAIHQKGITASLSASISNLTDTCDDIINCQNGGKCVRSSRADSYGCRCLEPFEGEYCEIDPRDPCREYTCINKGKCRVHDSKPHCICKSGFSGDFCEQRPAICSNHHCENGGTCVLHKRRQKCVCRKNFYGKRCESKANKRNKKRVKVNVWTVRMLSTKKSCASSRVHSTSCFTILISIILSNSMPCFLWRRMGSL